MDILESVIMGLQVLNGSHLHFDSIKLGGSFDVCLFYQIIQFIPD